MMPITERLQEYRILQVVSYGINYVAQIRRIFLDGYSVLDVRIVKSNHGFLGVASEGGIPFIYEDNLISRRYFDAKKALITTPSNSPISTTFFSNNSVQDFQENYDDEADERSLSNGFQPKFTPKLIHSSQHAQSSQREPKPSKPFQSKNKGLVSKTFDWDEEETQVKVLMALADDELSVGKNHARNGEWIDITMKKINILLSIDEDSDWQTYLKYINIDLKYVEEKRLNLLSKYNKIVFELNKYRDDLLALQHPKLEAVTFQIQNTKLTKLNHALQDEHKEERK
nr:retrovirus-related Pol polyprotein from transposon TNT 1-94 [Tanacetum cinerariifolium]